MTFPISSTNRGGVSRQNLNSLLGLGVKNAVQDLSHKIFDIPEYNDIDVPIFSRPALSAQRPDGRANNVIYGTTNKERLNELMQASRTERPENQLGDFE